MQIFVKAPNLGDLTLDVEPSDAFSCIHEAIESHYGIPLTSQYVLCNGRCIKGLTRTQSSSDASISFEQLGIQAYATLQLVTPLVGGSPIFIRPQAATMWNAFKRLVKDLNMFHPPWAAMAFWGIPCAVNYYGIYKFATPDFMNNKPSTSAAPITADDAEE